MNSSKAPKVSPVLYHLFLKIARAELSRNFHAVRILRKSLRDFADCRVVYANHPSWWDPLVLLCLAQEFFPTCRGFAPIDRASLERYRILGRIGFFGIEPGTRRGALAFLRTAEAILRQPPQMLWLTPQGKFSDERQRPLGFQRGLAHLATRLSTMKFLPVALEYDFWTEKRAEILIAFGEPLLSEPSVDPATFTYECERALEAAQQQLALAGQRRQPSEWTILHRGRVSISPVYDAWRKLRGRIRGRADQIAHVAE